MKRPVLRVFLVVALLLSAGFAAWSWLRPYAWTVDPGARCEVVGSEVKKDFSNFWVNVHLKLADGASHDLMKPVRLITAAREIEPADTTLGGKTGGGTTDLWFKFWLETSDLDGPLKLRINEGFLEIRSGSGIPRLGASGLEYFTTSDW